MRTRHDLTSAERKQMPVHRGAFKYFPDALMLLSMLSLRADRKHTPDADPNDLSRPQWVKGASADHGDCLGRHQFDIGEMDPEMGLDFLVHVFWRAGAQLQAYVEQHGIDAVVDWDWEPPASAVEDRREGSPEADGWTSYYLDIKDLEQGERVFIALRADLEGWTRSGMRAGHVYEAERNGEDLRFVQHMSCGCTPYLLFNGFATAVRR